MALRIQYRAVPNRIFPYYSVRVAKKTRLRPGLARTTARLPATSGRQQRISATFGSSWKWKHSARGVWCPHDHPRDRPTGRHGPGALRPVPAAVEAPVVTRNLPQLHYKAVRSKPTGKLVWIWALLLAWVIVEALPPRRPR
jgi:hypothetical protein